MARWMSEGAERTGSISEPVRPRRFSKSSRSNGFAAATTSAPFRRSSGSTAVLARERARQRAGDELRVELQRVDLAVRDPHRLRHRLASPCPRRRPRASRRASGNWNEARTSTGEISARRRARPPERDDCSRSSRARWTFSRANAVRRCVVGEDPCLREERPRRTRGCSRSRDRSGPRAGSLPRSAASPEVPGM